MKSKLLFLLVALAATTALSQNPSVPKPKPIVLADVYRQFMERYADDNPAWKTEITLSAEVANPPAAPYHLYYSETLGYYSYRVKRWDELSDYEQFAVQNDPRLSHFVRELFGKPQSPKQVATDKENKTPASKPATPTKRADTTSFTLAATSAPQAVHQTQASLVQNSSTVYRFDAADLLTSKPLHLTEVSSGR
jgi:hypothetical protein